MDAVCTKRGKNEMDYVTHLKPDGTYQPLREHEENVAALAGEFAAAFGAHEHGHRTGLLHDIGKYSANGQKRQRDPAHTAKVDHASAGAQMAARLGDPFAAFAVAGHHGGLPDRGDKTNDGGGTLCARLNKHLTGGNDPSAWKMEIEIPAKARFPAWLAAEKDARRLAMYTRMLFSCLVDADYLDTETAIQGGQPRGEGETPERLLEKLNAHVAPWLEAPANDLCAKRSEILARCLRGGEDERGLYTLTVPTGGGKTISSLAFALSHAAKHGMKRVIYVIPYTSIIEQNADVFAKVLGEENVLEHHSQVEFADDGEETPEAYRKRLACENWDAPVVVTTAVQFFESLYAAKTSKCRKLHHIANSVVIFDEAQTIPVPFLMPCVSAIGELVQHYGVTAVLCTATQPALGKLFKQLAPTLVQHEIAPDPDGLFDDFVSARGRFYARGAGGAAGGGGAGALHRQHEETRAAGIRKPARGGALPSLHADDSDGSRRDAERHSCAAANRAGLPRRFNQSGGGGRGRRFSVGLARVGRAGQHFAGGGAL